MLGIVEPRKYSLAFKGSPSIKVNIFRSQMVVFNVISSLFKGYTRPDIQGQGPYLRSLDHLGGSSALLSDDQSRVRMTLQWFFFAVLPSSYVHNTRAIEKEIFPGALFEKNRFFTYRKGGGNADSCEF